jgi:hypothetical protein
MIGHHYSIATLQFSHLFNLDNNGQQHHLVLIVYKFDRVPPHCVQIQSHGNAKNNVPYCRTMKSTVKKLKQELESTASRKDSIYKVMKLKGGNSLQIVRESCH